MLGLCTRVTVVDLPFGTYQGARARLHRNPFCLGHANVAVAETYLRSLGLVRGGVTGKAPRKAAYECSDVACDFRGSEFASMEARMMLPFICFAVLHNIGPC